MAKKTKRNVKKPIIQKIKEGVDSEIVDVKKGAKTYSNKFKKFWKSLLKKEKIKILIKFFLIISGYGLIINYSLHYIFPKIFTFTIKTLFAWGIAYYFISDEFVEWFRRLIAKR